MDGSSSRPRVIVELDFGTAYSGFAFAHITEPNQIYTHYDYPKAGAMEKPYCKTLTASYYKPLQGLGFGSSLKLQSWGYPARSQYAHDILQTSRHRRGHPRGPDVEGPSLGTYLTRFKLYLAAKDLGASSARALPPGLTAELLITDYLREMSALIVTTV